jgi:hypothetical protein
MIKQLCLLLKVICAAHELQWIILEQSLVSLLVLVRLTQNLSRVNLELGVPCPCTIANVLLDFVPVPAVVARKESLCMTILSRAGAVHNADPKKIVRLRMELYNLCTEIVWDRRRVETVP